MAAAEVGTFKVAAEKCARRLVSTALPAHQQQVAAVTAPQTADHMQQGRTHALQHHQVSSVGRLAQPPGHSSQVQAGGALAVAGHEEPGLPAARQTLSEHATLPGSRMQCP